MIRQRRGVDEVLRYYALVDAGDIEALVSLFSHNAEYARPGHVLLCGRAALESFYRDTRVIADGEHRLDTILAEGNQVAVHGSFRGHLRSGDEVAVRFADFFVLTSENLFARRDTFFFEPSV
ncbi:nuclear transport factor 2 family protein [Micromonospora orduensis]|uniref:nuclear transport factor 2 family protein n=1 Tax=Micromonospora orduensis TaxID=1420891 RepID=UPI0038294701